MASLLPFRDINVHASTSHYAFTSPSSPSAPTLVVDRPTGDIRLNDGALLGGKRVSTIAGILGMIKLRLGGLDCAPSVCGRWLLTSNRQVHNRHHESPTDGSVKGPYGLQGHCYRILAIARATTPRRGRRLISLIAQNLYQIGAHVLLLFF